MKKLLACLLLILSVHFLPAQDEDAPYLSEDDIEALETELSGDEPEKPLLFKLPRSND